MSKQITMPEQEKTLTEAVVKEMDRLECAEALRSTLDRYRRTHGLQSNAGPGMLLMGRAMELLLEEPAVEITAAPSAPEGHRLFVVAEKHAVTVQKTIDFLVATDPV